MFNVAKCIRRPTFLQINHLKSIHSHSNHIYLNCFQSFSTATKLSKKLLDDSEDIDPELIQLDSEIDKNESSINQKNSEYEELTAEQYEQIQNYYLQQKQQQNETQIPLPSPIQSQSKLSLEEIQQKQKKVWSSISNTLQGIWESMDSMDKTNIKRIDRVFQKLLKLEELHVKNIQHSLHHIAMLREEVSTVNSRINHVFHRLSDLEKTAPSEWLEWSIPKFEIPFADGIYLRSPGYEIGSMIWCIEIRWELDESMVNNDDDISDHDAEIEGFNPIIDMSEDSDDRNMNENEGEIGGEYDRMKKGYRRLGIYVSPRSVANWERLSSLKATCELRVNENDYSDAISIHRKEGNEEEEDGVDYEMLGKQKKKQQHFSVSGEFLRAKKLTSWGRTIPDGDSFFDANKIDDEISIKLRIVNQTLSYQQFADEEKDNVVSGTISEKDFESQTTKMSMDEEVKFDFDERGSKLLKKQRKNEINEDIHAQVLSYMNISINEFWKIFSDEIESSKSKQGVSVMAIAKACDLEKNLVSIFRKGPMTFSVDDEEIENEETATSKTREKRKKKLLKRKMVQSKQWDAVIEHDSNNPDFRKALAVFLVKYQFKKTKNLRSKASF